MSEIEKLIEALIEDHKFITGPRASNISKAINILSTLQPQNNEDLADRIIAIRGTIHDGDNWNADSSWANLDVVLIEAIKAIRAPVNMAAPSTEIVENPSNAELVKNLINFKNCLLTTGNSGYGGFTIEHADKAIAALSRPEKFDVLEHLRGGAKVIATNGDIFCLEKKILLFVLHSHRRADGFEIVHQPDLNIFFTGVIEETLQPYDPEPTPQEILEKARESVGLITGDIVPNDLKAASEALDCLEKLLSE